MKILALSNCEPIESLGSGYVIANFVRGLTARGHSVRLAGPNETVLAPQFRRAGSLRLALGMLMAARRLIAATSPDIVEFYGGEGWLATWWLGRKRSRGFRIVAHSNGIETHYSGALEAHAAASGVTDRSERWYQGWLTGPVHLAFTKADAIVTVSQADAEFALAQRYQPASRILAVNNALPAEFIGLTPSFHRSKVIGFCGSWLPNKGVALVARDISAVLRTATDWKLQLVGVRDGFRVEDHFPADLLPRIDVLPFVTPKSELIQVYQGWSIALMPSTFESFGLAAVEAMACGAALVATRTGFAAGLKDGHEALMISAPRSPLLQHAVTRLIEDEELRQRIARNGWSRVQELRWPVSLDAIERFYGDLIRRIS
jgi:glycosyltransferase involved in cell wall biosynthesis